MRKISAEMPSNPQQSDLGMESNASIALDVATMTGAGCTMAAAEHVVEPGWAETPAKFSCAAGASARGSRFVSALDGASGAPAGFGRGWRIGEVATFGGNTGGRCDEMTGLLVLTGDGGVIVGGDRRGGTAGVRDGRGIRAISCLAPSFWRPGVVSGLWGSALRTVSFFGSAMTGHVAPRKIAENSFVVTR
jgi:hypothetical protein